MVIKLSFDDFKNQLVSACAESYLNVRKKEFSFKPHKYCQICVKTRTDYFENHKEFIMEKVSVSKIDRENNVTEVIDIDKDILLVKEDISSIKTDALIVNSVNEFEKENPNTPKYIINDLFIKIKEMLYKDIIKKFIKDQDIIEIYNMEAISLEIDDGIYFQTIDLFTREVADKAFDNYKNNSKFMK